jgi:hypothetical protein
MVGALEPLMQAGVFPALGQRSRQLQVKIPRERAHLVLPRTFRVVFRRELLAFEQVASRVRARAFVGDDNRGYLFNLFLGALKRVPEMRKLIAAIADLLVFARAVSGIEAPQSLKHLPVKPVENEAGGNENGDFYERCKHVLMIESC